MSFPTSKISIKLSPTPHVAARSRLYNRPGQIDLNFRQGEYHYFLRQIIDRLAIKTRSRTSLETASTRVTDAASLQDGTSLEDAQRRHILFNLSEERNWPLALAKSWSIVADILTFYQERILEEGYLRTAKEKRSVHDLVQLLHYQPQPAVSGSALLAMQSTEVEGFEAEPWVDIGLSITSVPPPGSEAQNFEVDEAIRLRAKWSRLSLDDPPIIPPDLILPRFDFDGSLTELSLQGSINELTIGSPVLMLASESADDHKFLRFLTAVETSREPDLTMISWSPALLPEHPESPLTGLTLQTFRLEQGLFGSTAPLWQDQPLEVRLQQRPLEGGVLVLATAGWLPKNQGLPTPPGGLPFRCLAVTEDGSMFVGTSADGIFRSRDEGDSWQAVNRGLQHLDIRTLRVGPRKTLLAGSVGGGLYRSSDDGEVWELINGQLRLQSPRQATPFWPFGQVPVTLGPLPAVTVRDVLTRLQRGETQIFAATDQGVFLTINGGQEWRPFNDGLPLTDEESGATELIARALAAAEGSSARDLIAGNPNRLFVGTAAGVFCRHLKRGDWKPFNVGLPETDPKNGLSLTLIESLSILTDPVRGMAILFAGTDRGLFSCPLEGTRWHRVEGGPLGSIRALAQATASLTSQSSIYAGGDRGLWLSEDLGSTWRSVGIGPSKAVQAIALGQDAKLRIVAVPFSDMLGDEWPGFFLRRGQIDLEAQVPPPAIDSWIVLWPGGNDLGAAGIFQVKSVSTVRRRDFTLDTSITRIGVVSESPLSGFDLRTTRVYLQSEIASLVEGRQLTRTERLQRLKDFLLVEEIESARQLLVTWEDSETRRPSSDPPEFIGTSTTTSELISALDAVLEDAQPKPSDSESTKLAAALKQSDNITIFGNVAPLIEGTTIDEILGDGDASQANQSFQLSFPLSFERGPGGIQSTLEIRVNGLLWKEKEALYEKQPEERVYSTYLDSQGMATVTFGDGSMGARPVSGLDNISARYKTGSSDRVVIPGALGQLEGGPPGLTTVSNPLPSTPGATQQSTQAIRQEAPLSIRTFDRIASRQDYEDFALQFPGISKAIVHPLLLDGQRQLHLTLAGAEEAPAVDGTLRRDLWNAIEQARADVIPVIINSFSRIELSVHADVSISPDVANEADLELRIKDALMQRFGFTQSRFGECIVASDVISPIQRLPGVLSVRLEGFVPLEAQPPLSRSGSSFDGAQLIILPLSNISLEVKR